ncbi:MAG: DUF484 family protein, partial [Gammaproteobacteria bacterium]|nr:DUF484 family protein [Gammaproteobacteria bacterium]
RIWTGFRRIQVECVSAESLPNLITDLVGGGRREFPDVDCVSIASVDLEYEISRILAVDDEASSLDGKFLIVSKEKLEQLLPDTTKPWLGPCSADIQSTLFPGYDKPLGSVALAPLRLGDELIGCLNQGSRDRRHFSAGTATELLEHLASIVAMCIQNTVNKTRLERHGLTDPLTGVANRRQLERRLLEEIERWQRHGHDLTCVMIDIDHFKKVNDLYGHSMGDRVLQDVAKTLGHGLRSSDILSRYGGEEFLLVLPETALKKATTMARRLHRRLAQLKYTTDHTEPLGITVSIGVAAIEPGTSQSSELLAQSLIERCDAALYQAKRTGRNKVVVAG